MTDDDQARSLERHLNHIIDTAFGHGTNTGEHRTALLDACRYLYEIHRHDPPTVLPNSTGIAREEHRGGVCDICGNTGTDYLGRPCRRTRHTTAEHAAMNANAPTEAESRAKRETDRLKRAVIEWAPPSPPPPPHTGHDRITELNATAAELEREVDALHSKLEQVRRVHEAEHGLRLYRADAKCVAIHPHHSEGVDLELETDTGDRLRLRLAARALRGRGNLAALLTAPLRLYLEELDPISTRPSSPATTNTDTDHHDDEPRHARFF